MKKAVTIVICLTIAICLLFFFRGSDDSQLNESQIAALYEIDGLTDAQSKLRFYNFQLIDDQQISLVLLNENAASPQKVRKIFELVKKPLNSFQKLELLIDCRGGIDKSVFDELRKIKSINSVYLFNENREDALRDYDFESNCNELNWKCNPSRLHGKLIRLHPSFELHTQESLRRSKLGWAGRIREDLGFGDE